MSINDLSWGEYLKILFYIIHTRIYCLFETCILQLESMQACMYILLLWIYVCVNILVYIHARMFWPWSLNQYFRRLLGNFSFSELFSLSLVTPKTLFEFAFWRGNNPNGVKASPYCSDLRSPDNSDEVFAHIDELRLQMLRCPTLSSFHCCIANFLKLSSLI
jgi:hypothetical protein